jgi:hypothetical protein
MLVKIYIIYMKSTSLTYLLFTIARAMLGTLEVACHAMHTSACHCTAKSGGPTALTQLLSDAFQLVIMPLLKNHLFS